MSEQGGQKTSKFSTRTIAIITAIGLLMATLAATGYYFLIYRNKPEVLAGEVVSRSKEEPIQFTFEIQAQAESPEAETEMLVVPNEIFWKGKGIYDSQNSSLWLKEIQRKSGQDYEDLKAQIYLEEEDTFIWRPENATAQVIVEPTEDSEPKSEWIKFSNERNIFDYDSELKDLWLNSFLTDFRPWFRELWLNQEPSAFAESSDGVVLSETDAEKMRMPLIENFPYSITSSFHEVGIKPIEGKSKIDLTIDKEKRHFGKIDLDLQEVQVFQFDPETKTEVSSNFDLKVNLQDFVWVGAEASYPSELGKSFLTYSDYVGRSYGIVGNVENQGLLWQPSSDYSQAFVLPEGGREALKNQIFESTNYQKVFKPAIDSEEVGIMLAPTMNGKEISPVYSNFYYCAFEQAKDKREFFKASLLPLMEEDMGKVDINKQENLNKLLQQWRTDGLELGDEERFGSCVQNQDYKEAFDKIPYDKILPANESSTGLYIISANPEEYRETRWQDHHFSYNYSYLKHLQEPYGPYKLVKLRFCEKVDADQVNYKYSWTSDLPSTEHPIQFTKSSQKNYEDRAVNIGTDYGYCGLTDLNVLLIFDDEIDDENKFIIHRKPSDGEEKIVFEKTYSEFFNLVDEGFAGARVTDTYEVTLYFKTGGGFDRIFARDPGLQLSVLRR